MPTYNYKCKECSQSYNIELTLSEKEDYQPECPACQSTDVFQTFNRVGVLGGSQPGGSSACSISSCSSGNCSSCR